MPSNSIPGYLPMKNENRSTKDSYKYIMAYLIHNSVKWE